MFLVFESRVHEDAQDLDMVFGLHDLPLDRERHLIRFMGLRREVYNGCFVCLKRHAASFLPLKSFIVPAVDLRCTRSALKKRNKIGDSGEPCGSPAWGRLFASDNCPFLNGRRLF